MVDIISVHMFGSNSSDVSSKQINNISEIYEIMNKCKNEWLFIYDAVRNLDKDNLSILTNYLLNIGSNINVIVDKKAWYPFLIRRNWLKECLIVKTDSLSITEIHKRIRKNENVEIFNYKWPFLYKKHPSAQERYNMGILKKWWGTYDFNYIRNNEFVRNAVHEIVYLDESQFSEFVQYSYDTIILYDVSDDIWAKLLRKIENHLKVKCFVTDNYKVFISEYNESRNFKKNERSIDQTAWLVEIKHLLNANGLLINDLIIADNGSVIHVYKSAEKFHIKKLYADTNKTAVLIDMPGIGDAVRLINLFPEIKEKYNNSEVTAIINPKASLVYELCEQIDDIFICSLRPDLPNFEYIVPNLLKEYLMTHKFQYIVPFVWDLTAYVENRKRNFIDVYAGIANVSGKQNCTININSEFNKKVQYLIDNFKIDLTKPVLGVQFKASMSSKSWSYNRSMEFIETMVKLVPDIQIINFDFDVIETDKIYNLGQYCDIIMFIAAMKYCDYFIGVDSAGGHIAALVDIPCITIFGKEKPRIGNDHRPVSKINLSLIPAEDCECPEYMIECPKACKCIDQIPPSIVIYTLAKGQNLGYNSKTKKIELPIHVQTLWSPQDKYLVTIQDNITEYEFQKAGILMDLCDSFNIELGCIRVDKTLEYKIMGVDLWIQRDTFEFSSYGMLELELVCNDNADFILQHRLHEGWNIMHFNIPAVLNKINTMEFKILSSKKLMGKVLINKIYTVSV